jgi:sortase (surface protein transpeptidase)
MSDPDAGAGGHRATGPRGGRSRPGPGGLLDRLRSNRLAALLVGAGVVLAAVGATTAVSRFTDHAVATPVTPSAPDDPQAGDHVAAPPTPLKIPGATPPPAPPVPPLMAAQQNAPAAIAIHIPRLKVDRDLVGLHVQADRSLTVPKSFDDIGWWSAGPHPGGPGATLFAGHVSSVAGPGVFFDLKSMKVGDLVSVDRVDQTTAVFRVVGLASYPRSNFPDDIVYRVTGKPSIHLVTCDGAFSTAIGHHLDNLVVFADLISTGPTKAAK